MDNDGIDGATAVPTSGDESAGIARDASVRRLGRVAPIPAEAVAHRESFMRFVLDEAEPWHRAHLGRLYARWNEWNDAFFGGQMVAPYIMLPTTGTPKIYGDCSSVSGFGGKSQIRIRASLQRGTHPHTFGWKHSDCDRFVHDVLLHEMLHQFAQEITGKNDAVYHGHGPAFRDKANEIGVQLDFLRVRTCKRRGPDAELPSCSQWPHNVRPAGYYPEQTVETFETVETVELPDIDEVARLVVAYWEATTDMKRRGLLALVRPR